MIYVIIVAILTVIVGILSQLFLNETLKFACFCFIILWIVGTAFISGRFAECEKISEETYSMLEIAENQYYSVSKMGIIKAYYLNKDGKVEKLNEHDEINVEIEPKKIENAYITFHGTKETMNKKTRFWLFYPKCFLEEKTEATLSIPEEAFIVF